MYYVLQSSLHSQTMEIKRKMISIFCEYLKALGALLNIYDTILRNYLFIGKLTRPFKNMNKEGAIKQFQLQKRLPVNHCHIFYLETFNGPWHTK